MTSLQSIQFTPVWPHGKISEIFPNIFFVTGTNKIHHEGIDYQTSRNMTILRNGLSLSLINTVRLNEEGLRELEYLGSIDHIIRIGAFHGRDDAFYRARYPAALLWTLKGMTYDNGLRSDQELTLESSLPFPECSLFVFETSILPEGILHIKQEEEILISCDSLQNVTSTDEFYSPETAQLFQDQGLVKSANISPVWLEATHTKSSDFYRLLRTRTFRHLVSAHGEPLMNKAYEKVTETVQQVFS